MAQRVAEPDMKPVEGKKAILLSFDDELLLDARKSLFRKNVSIQQFVTHVFHRLSMADASAIDLLDQASKYNEEILAKEDREAISKIDPRTLYEMFEREDNK